MAGELGYVVWIHTERVAAAGQRLWTEDETLLVRDLSVCSIPSQSARRIKVQRQDLNI